MLKSKIQNFWYYYKYYLLTGALVLLALAIALNSCINRKDYDVNVLYATHGYSDTFYQGDELVTLFDTYAPDRNGDGVHDTQLVTINYGTTMQEYTSAGAARSANLASGKCLLFLLDKQNYQELSEGGFLEDLTVLGDSEYISGDAFLAYESGLLDNVSGFKAINEPYYLCLRKYDEVRAQKDEKFKDQYESAKKLLENIIQVY